MASLARHDVYELADDKKTGTLLHWRIGSLLPATDSQIKKIIGTLLHWQIGTLVLYYQIKFYTLQKFAKFASLKK